VGKSFGYDAEGRPQFYDRRARLHAVPIPKIGWANMNATVVPSGSPTSDICPRRYANSRSCWRTKQLGSPKNPTPEQHGILEAAGQLQQFESPLWMEIEEGAAKLDLLLPRQAVSFVQVSW
jgi:hypothetical protein